jgi:adenylosuccinate synthase
MEGWPASTANDQLPAALERYIARIEAAVGVPVTLVSLGPDRAQTMLRDASVAQ